jgi:TPR repeat protein
MWLYGPRASDLLGNATEKFALNYMLATQLFEEAFDAGYAPAAAYLSFMANAGLGGFTRSLTKANALGARAVELGIFEAAAKPNSDVHALWGLGWMFAGGIGIEKNITTAFGHWQESAEMDHRISQYYFGMCFENGYGHKKDLAQAVKYYELAANQGVAEAQCSLGGCYSHGRGVAQDIHQAMRLYRLAAEQGYASAQYILGVCYDNGHIVERNITMATKFYLLAANQGHVHATAALNKINSNNQGTDETNEVVSDNNVQPGQTTSVC